ncbi:MAG: hypothetical protein IT365_29535 [Candidatus Hydrogenedentes bacterium]|nr:hypothetical protein [Candidatus Hydrogenedentota bacterium]
MSNKSLIAIGAVLILFLALPLIPQAFQTPASKQKVDAAPSGTVENTVADTVPAPPQPPPPPPPAPSIMTRMQFDQVRSGMTYTQCVQFIGSQGERVGNPRHAGDEEYTWQMVDSPTSTVSTAVANLRFKNGVLYGKGFNSTQGRNIASQGGMLSSVLPAERPATPPYICRSVYESMKNGSTYAECVQQLGVEGRYLGRTTMSGGGYSTTGAPIPAVADVYVWRSPVNRTTLTLTFRDGKLAGREIAGG